MALPALAPAPVIAQIVALVISMFSIEMTQEEHDSLVSVVTAFVGAVGALVIFVGSYFQRRKDKQ